MKRTVSFKDKDRRKFEIELEIEGGRFSMSGHWGGSSGQCCDSINPASPAQKQLVEMWDMWHLNDMKAGTNLQMKVTADIKGYDETLAELVQHNPDGSKMDEVSAAKMLEIWKEFNAAVPPTRTLETATLTEKEMAEFFYFNMVARYGGNELILAVSDDKSIKERAEKWFFNKTLLYDNGYRYGSAWLTESLPEDIEDKMNEIFDTIEEEEESHKDKLVSEVPEDEVFDYIKENADNLPGWADDEDECKVAVALAKMLDLSMNELGDIENERDNYWEVQGTTYLAGTDDQMNEELKENIKESVWAFQPQFLASFTEIDSEVFEVLSKQCEGANDAILSIIEKTGDFDDFVSEAESADGRGHFLNRWNGGELEAEVGGETFYAYQQ